MMDMTELLFRMQLHTTESPQPLGVTLPRAQSYLTPRCSALQSLTANQYSTPIESRVVVLSLTYRELVVLMANRLKLLKLLELTEFLDFLNSNPINQVLATDDLDYLRQVCVECHYVRGNAFGGGEYLASQITNPEIFHRHAAKTLKPQLNQVVRYLFPEEYGYFTGLGCLDLYNLLSNAYLMLNEIESPEPS